MNHADHVKLLRPAHVVPGGKWADLGAGTGAFTLALRELVGPDATIYAVDRDESSLRALEGAYARRFGRAGGLHALHGDFTAPLDLPRLDGAVMANSLHFFKDKVAVLRRVRAHLKPGGVLLLVEYNADKGNAWVPFPISFGRGRDALIEAGYAEPHLLATHPSNFLREFYSAAAINAAGWAKAIQA